MNKNNKSFESLSTYNGDYDGTFNLVVESLFEDDGEGNDALGNIIDKGLSFVPRLMRFKKAKTVMSRSLNLYIKKAKKIIDSFETISGSKIENISREYTNLKGGQIKKLIANDKPDEASELLKNFLSELEQYKSEQIAKLDKGIESVHQAYTTAVEKRIDSPGFVLNVELSEKGKGELKAKWQELSATADMKIDEYKTAAILKNEGFKKLDKIVAEVNSYISKNQAIKGDVHFTVTSIKQQGDQFEVESRPVIVGARYNVKEKGIIVSDEPDNMELGKGGKRYTYSGNRANTTRPYRIIITANIEEYILPYMLVHESEQPIYGDLVQIDDMITADKTDKPKANKPKPDSNPDKDKTLGNVENINKGDHEDDKSNN